MKFSDIRVFEAFAIVRGLRIGLLLLTLLSAPLALRAQDVNASVSKVDGKKVSVNVTFTDAIKYFSIFWGDGAYANVTASSGSRNKRVTHVYADCGTKSIIVNAAFENGHMARSDTNAKPECLPPAHPPAQEAELSCGVTCDIQLADGQSGCRPVPPWFIDNQKVLQQYLIEIGRRQEQASARGESKTDIVYPDLFALGYRCPDSQGYCDTAWIPSPASNHGLSKPDSFSGSELQKRPHTGVQRINGAGIGDQAILNMNPIDAVNIWGQGSDQGGEVCFKGTTGRLLYVDSRPTPNTKHWLTANVRGDNICGTLPGPGSIIYLPPE